MKAGGVIRDNCAVTEVLPGPDGVKLSTGKGCVTAKKVVLTVGPWARVWMEKLGITQKMRVCYVAKSFGLSCKSYTVTHSIWTLEIRMYGHSF